MLLRIRHLPDLTVLERQAVLAEEEIDPWCRRTFPQLRAELADRGIRPTGRPGLTLAAGPAAEGRSRVRAFQPVAARHAQAVLPGSLMLTTRHPGPLEALPRTLEAVTAYLRSGSAAAHGLAPVPDGELRETYLVGPGSGRPQDRWVTEVAVPVQRTS